MTFAHELQHFIQHRSSPKLFGANALVRILAQQRQFESVIKALAPRPRDIPHEREARIVSKRTAENLFGAEVVAQYINDKIAEPVTDEDAADWECIRGLVTSTPYDLACETKLFFRSLKQYRPQIEVVLQGLRNDDPTRYVDLDDLFNGT